MEDGKGTESSLDQFRILINIYLFIFFCVRDLHIIETHAPASHVYRRGTVILDAFTTNLRNGSDWVNDRDTGGQNNLVLENSFVDENGSLIALYSRGHTGGSFDVSIDFRAPIDVTVLWGSDPSGSVTQAELVNALDFRVTFANYPRSPDLIAHTVLMSVAFCILVVVKKKKKGKKKKKKKC